MYAEGLKHFTDIPLVIFAMFLFFAVFLIVLGRTLGKNAKYQEAAQLPLLDQELHDDQQ